MSTNGSNGAFILESGDETPEMICPKVIYFLNLFQKKRKKKYILEHGDEKNE